MSRCFKVLFINLFGKEIHERSDFVNPIDIRIKKDNERIKTNITLPAWLKRIAEEQKVNYYRLLETALIDYLQIPVSGRR